MNLGHCIEAELWTIFYGLCIAWETGWRKLILESNSASAIQVISVGLEKDHPLENMI